MIPARYSSSRLPGKPLINICGKPMLQRVYERVKAMDLFDDIFVATDSDKIADFCTQNNIKSIMTPVDCISGTDRVSLAIQKLNINIDAVVIIMGDEPLIEKKDVELLINCYTKNPEFVISLKRKIKDEKDVDSNSTIKAVCDKNDNLMFLSRSRIPYPQKDLYFDYYKILGCYIFPFNIIKNHFDLPVGYLEKI